MTTKKSILKEFEILAKVGEISKLLHEISIHTGVSYDVIYTMAKGYAESKYKNNPCHKKK